MIIPNEILEAFALPNTEPTETETTEDALSLLVKSIGETADNSNATPENDDAPDDALSRLVKKLNQKEENANE